MLIITLSIGTGIFVSCEDLDNPKEMEIEKFTITDITGTSAVVKIQKNDITAGNAYLNYPASTRLYYGSSSNVEDMKDYAIGHAEGIGLFPDILAFNLQNLKPDTRYWFAFRPDTIYAFNASYSMSLVNDQGYKGFVIPADNSFTTAKDLPPVDLGLSVLWAQTDLGSDEWWYTQTYTWSVEKYENRERPKTMSIAGSSQDHTTVMLGEDWHTPTLTEYNELIANCDFSIKFDDEWGGFVRCTSRINGKYIDFCPRNGGLLDSWTATYWTSSVADMGDPNYSLWKVYKIDFPSDLTTNTEFVSDTYYTATKKAQIRPVKKK